MIAFRGGANGIVSRSVLKRSLENEVRNRIASFEFIN